MSRMISLRSASDAFARASASLRSASCAEERGLRERARRLREEICEQFGAPGRETLAPRRHENDSERALPFGEGAAERALEPRAHRGASARADRPASRRSSRASSKIRRSNVASGAAKRRRSSSTSEPSPSQLYAVGSSIEPSATNSQPASAGRTLHRLAHDRAIDQVAVHRAAHFVARARQIAFARRAAARAPPPRLRAATHHRPLRSERLRG